ncbi:hypothetical protein DFJ63DRAFT_252260 [Scheffersomyces coipomensis]|uniref:uncharacterized protein n=1 Tax=Scheffersomyces coipomensis TaxID=1788519 RepID=UPI00315D982F
MEKMKRSSKKRGLKMGMKSISPKTPSSLIQPTNTLQEENKQINLTDSNNKDNVDIQLSSNGASDDKVKESLVNGQISPSSIPLGRDIYLVGSVYVIHFIVLMLAADGFIKANVCLWVILFLIELPLIIIASHFLQWLDSRGGLEECILEMSSNSMLGDFVIYIYTCIITPIMLTGLFDTIFHCIFPSFPKKSSYIYQGILLIRAIIVSGSSSLRAFFLGTI